MATEVLEIFDRWLGGFGDLRVGRESGGLGEITKLTRF